MATRKRKSRLSRSKIVTNDIKQPKSDRLETSQTKSNKESADKSVAEKKLSEGPGSTTPSGKDGSRRKDQATGSTPGKLAVLEFWYIVYMC